MTRLAWGSVACFKERVFHCAVFMAGIAVEHANCWPRATKFGSRSNSVAELRDSNNVHAAQLAAPDPDPTSSRENRVH